MGIDLRLLPHTRTSNGSFDVVTIHRDYAIFDKIRKLPQMEIDDGFYSYLSEDGDCEETHFGDTIYDKYGYRLKWVLAKDLKSVKIPGPAGAFVHAMEDRDRVALYWS